MSASNWTYCPRCTIKGRQVGLFDTDETLSEDLRIGIYENEQEGTFHFVINYEAACAQCDFVYKFKEQRKILL